VGGPGHAECTFSGQLVRASSNHPVIDRAIAMVAAGDAAAGASPEVRTCADYRDSLGHLAGNAQQPIGESIGRFYSLRDAGGGSARRGWPLLERDARHGSGVSWAGFFSAPW